jgi:solute carrier family 25 (mitochondrial phosphate transporter), member 23/24/25/41
MTLIYELLTGGFAGALSRTLTAPFELTKILKQNNPNYYGNKRTPNIIGNIFKKHGIPGLLKGNSANCLRVVPQKSIQLSVYNRCIEYQKKNCNFTKNQMYFNSGALSGIVSYSLIYPLETIRSKISADINSTNKLNKSLYSTLRNTGIRNLYNGWIISSIGLIPFQGITFLGYNWLKDKYNKDNNKLLNLPIGTVSSLLGVGLTYPFDVIKRKYHLSGELGNKIYKGYSDLIRTTYNLYGIRGFYRGVFACLSKIGPANAIFFFTVDYMNAIKR